MYHWEAPLSSTGHFVLHARLVFGQLGCCHSIYVFDHSKSWCKYLARQKLVGNFRDTENLVVYKCYYHGMQVGAEDDVFPDDAVELERRQPGDKHYRATGGCSLHSCWRTRNCRQENTAPYTSVHYFY